VKPRISGTVSFRQLRQQESFDMSFTVSRIADHGTGNPIAARLTLQIFAILDQCNLSKEAADHIKAIYMDSLRKKLMCAGKSRTVTGRNSERSWRLTGSGRKTL
jgi:hypothetical protein